MKSDINYNVVETHISEVRGNDLILHEGFIRTVSNHHIKTGFMGVTLFGDSYRLGTIPVKKLYVLKVLIK